MEDYHNTVNAYATQYNKFDKFYSNYNNEQERVRFKDEAAKRLASGAHDMAVSRAQAALGLNAEEAQALTEQSVAAGAAGSTAVALARRYNSLRKGDGDATGDGVADKAKLEDTTDSTSLESEVTQGAMPMAPPARDAPDAPAVESVPVEEETSAVLGPMKAPLGPIPDDILDRPGGRLDLDGGIKTQQDSGELLRDTKQTTAVGEEATEGAEGVEGLEAGLEGAGVGAEALTAGEAAAALAPEALPVLLAVGGIAYGVSKLLNKDKNQESIANSKYVPPPTLHSALNLPVNTIFSQSAEFTIPTYDSVTDIAPSVTAW